LTVGASIVEGAMNFGVSARDAWQQARALMDRVRLPVTALDRYPHQFSGGQRQRIAIARALASQPDVVVADEAVSALDVSVQAEVLRLLREIRDEYQLGLLFITHDLRVAAQLCDRIVVMHAGQVVETGATHEVYARPQHDYTRRLLAAAPKGPESVLAAPTSTEPAA
jgi:peptide/nickel transport system ATP-binding protein